MKAPYGYGQQAKEVGRMLPLQVLESGAGFYLGTVDEEGFPCSRESVEYWPTQEDATLAAETGDWTQRDGP